MRRVRLITRRVEINITQAELARRVGTTQQAIARYEGGVTSPRPELAAKIAVELDWPAAELFPDLAERYGVFAPEPGQVERATGSA